MFIWNQFINENKEFSLFMQINGLKNKYKMTLQCIFLVSQKQC